MISLRRVTGTLRSASTLSEAFVLARLKVRFVINQGRHGAPMAKLGRIAEQTEKFLRVLASDYGLDVKPGEWLAADFKNGSVDYLAEFPREVSPAIAEIFSAGLEVLADYNPEDEGLNGRVGEHAALEYSKIGALLDPDEIIRMGVIRPHSSQPKWRDITYSTLSSIRREMEQPITSHGSIQGIVHSWFKEARDPYFQIRELATENLVKVFYDNSIYAQVAKAVQDRNTTLFVSGKIRFDKVVRRAVEMNVDKIEIMQMMTSSEFEELFGIAPKFEPSFIEEDQWQN